MARLTTIPTILDDALSLTIGTLRRCGFLIEDKLAEGTMQWLVNKEVRASVHLSVDLRYISEYMTVSYIYNGEEMEYTIQLELTSSNLGKGSVWYFTCPLTGKRCRKLYLIDGVFCHPFARSNCFYATQVRSKYDRRIDARYGPYFDRERNNIKLDQKYMKKTYRGKLTKKYARLIELKRRADSISDEEIEMLLIYG